METTNYNDFVTEFLHKGSRQKKKYPTYYTATLLNKIIKDNKLKIKSATYSKLIRRTHELLLDEIFRGSIIKFPYGFATMYLKQKETDAFFNDKHELIKTMPVDWLKTLHYWYEDEEAKANKVLIFRPPSTVYKIKFNIGASVVNKKAYKFRPHRSVKQKLKNLIIQNKIIGSYT